MRQLFQLLKSCKLSKSFYLLTSFDLSKLFDSAKSSDLLHIHKKRYSSSFQACPGKGLFLCLCLSLALALSGCQNHTTDDQLKNQNLSSDEVLTDNSMADSTSKNPGNSSDTPNADTSSNTTSNTTPKTITLCMVGDILLHTPVEEACMQEDGSYDFSVLFENTKQSISKADIALVNEEVILGGKDLGVSGYPAFNGPYEVADALEDAGFDVALQATNHALDKGSKGVLNCLSNWETNHPDMEALGIHDSVTDQNQLYIEEINGIKIAILNYTYGTNGISMPNDMSYLVDLLDEEKVVTDIQIAKASADFVIVCPHWGTEYQLTPDSMQKKWTSIFYEQGVDLVIGTHPHVIEPIEIISEEGNDHEMLVYYSLGNYVNWTSGTGTGVANRMVGGMANVTITFDEVTKKAAITDYGVTALISHVTKGTNGVTVYPLSQYNESLGNENAIRSQDSDFSYDYCVNLCNEIWGSDWE